MQSIVANPAGCGHRWPSALLAAAGLSGALAVALVVTASCPWRRCRRSVPTVVCVLAARRIDPVDGLQANELARLAGAEVALAEAASTQAAARQLAKQARALLDAPGGRW